MGYDANWNQTPVKGYYDNLNFGGGTDENGNPIVSTTPTAPGTPAPTPATPAVPFTGYVDPNNQDPQQLAAQLISQQFADWEKTFKPIELQQMEQVSMMHPKVLTDAVAKAQEGAEGSSNAMDLASDRQLWGLGIQPQADQQNDMSRIKNISRSLNVAGAENTARTNQKALDEKILFGTAPNPNLVNSLTMPKS